VLAALDEGAHADAALELLASPNSLGMRVRVALHGAHMAAAARRRRSSTVSCLSLEADASALGAGGAGGPAEHATADDARQVGGAAPPTSQWRSAISRRQSVKLAANASSVAVPPAGADRSGEASRRQSARTASSSGDHGRWRPRPSRGSQPTSEPGDYNLSKLARASAHSLIAGLMGSAAASPSRAGGSALAPGAPTQSPGWLRGVGALSSAARVAPASGAGGGARAAGGGKAPKPTFPQGFRALYAEDDAVLRKSVVLRVFKPLGITVDEAHDGAEVLRLCDVRERELGAGAADAYAFVLLDNQMPHLTGTQVAKELRARGYSAHIVGMTGDPRGCTDRAIFEVSGVDHCFDKDSASVSKVRELLAAYAISDAISGEPVAAASPSSFPPPGFSPGVKGQGDVAGPSMEATETAPSSAVVGPTKMDTIPDDPGAEAPSFRHALGHDS
jgi:CheY-like chemotaxis protein